MHALPLPLALVCLVFLGVSTLWSPMAAVHPSAGTAAVLHAHARIAGSSHHAVYRVNHR